MTHPKAQRIATAPGPRRWQQALARSRIAACALAAVWCAACSSPEPRYYTLAPGADTAAAAKPRMEPPLWIEVAPVSIPEHLNRPQLVLRGGTNGDEIKVMEFAQWSAPLRDELRDALSLRLQSALGAMDAYKLAATRDEPRFRIAAEVVRMDAGIGLNAVATINWTVRNPFDGSTIIGNTKAELPVAANVDGVVAAYRQVVAAAATDIAAAVLSQQH
jgi:uncharacterized lipoprotein YmbA